MSAAAPSLETNVEEQPVVELVASAENDPSYAAEPEVVVWVFDPGICG